MLIYRGGSLRFMVLLALATAPYRDAATFVRRVVFYRSAVLFARKTTTAADAFNGGVGPAKRLRMTPSFSLFCAQQEMPYVLLYVQVVVSLNSVTAWLGVFDTRIQNRSFLPNTGTCNW